MMADKWKKFRGDGKKNPLNIEDFETNSPAPSWRNKEIEQKEEAYPYKATAEEIEIVNAALYLRRPILVTGNPGVGKSTLAYAIAHELGLGEVLHWHINTKSTVEDGLYSYDAIARLQDVQSLKANQKAPSLKKYIKLNPLGQAFGSSKKRVLLIDEIDKSDIDLPNNLLQLFEDKYFEIDVLKRLGITEEINLGDDKDKIIPKEGRIDTGYFPIVIMTSNNERDFPPAFMRRCLHHHIEAPDETRMLEIVKKHLSQEEQDKVDNLEEIITEFISKRNKNHLATDQLLNALHLRLNDDITVDAFEKLKTKVWHKLSGE
jgi:MoxR-like ATPase